MEYTEALSASEEMQQMARWASLLWRAGYPTELHTTEHYGDEEFGMFGWEWHVFDGWHGSRIATIDNDGCGASWHGPDNLWLAVIGPSERVTD